MVRFIFTNTKELCYWVQTLNSTMVRFICVSNPLFIAVCIFKFHYGKIHILCDFFSLERTSNFKFHYGKIHMFYRLYFCMCPAYFKFHYGKIHMLRYTRKIVCICVFKFHYGKIHMVFVESVKLPTISTLNSTMVRFILLRYTREIVCICVFKFHYGKIHIYS